LIAFFFWWRFSVKLVAMIGYHEARELVIARVRGMARAVETECVPLREAMGRVLAREILSDREYPPFDRSIRDGYAVRAADTGVGVRLRCVGELKAGDTPGVAVSPGTCVQIMTGAALPEGTDAVVMVEHTNFQSGREGDVVRLDRAVQSGQHVVRRGSEGAAGQVVIAAGTRMGFAEMAAAAQVGAANPVVVRKPRVAILTTGDEVVDFAATPGPFQIRNSNSVSLAAQVALCGAEAVILGNAGDSLEDIRAKILVGLAADMLILSGGVSMGKYDLVEPVLKELGAEIVFDAVAIRPGKPVVFAVCDGKPIFGLPGNPVSTMVTFELFVRPAIDLLCGELEARALPFTDAILTAAMSEKPGLTHFLPAKLTWGTETPRVAAIAWQGSGDVGAMSRANCLLVVGAERERIEAGEPVRVLPLGFC
jgi:molybdopterin molybdotransferase